MQTPFSTDSLAMMSDDFSYGHCDDQNLYGFFKLSKNSSRESHNLERIFQLVLDLDRRFLPYQCWPESLWRTVFPFLDDSTLPLTVLSENPYRFFFIDHSIFGRSLFLFHAPIGGETAHLLKIISDEKMRESKMTMSFYFNVLKILKSQNPQLENLYLEVEEGNDRAIQFYRKVGFQVLHIQKNFYLKPHPKSALKMSSSTWSF